jgi:hypothetical protein
LNKIFTAFRVLQGSVTFFGVWPKGKHKVVKLRNEVLVMGCGF